MNEIETIQLINWRLTRWIWWYRFRRAVSWAVHGLIAGLAISLVLSAAGMLRGLLLRQEFVFIVVAGALLGILVGFTAGLLWPFQRLRAARLFDRWFGLRERVSTALELAGKPGTDSDQLLRQQAEDALAISSQVHPRQSLPIRILWPEWLAVLLLASITILAWWRGAPAFQAALQNRTIQATIQSQAKAIQDLRAAIQSDKALSPEAKQSLTRPLDEALQKLQNAKTQEEAVSALTNAEGQLQALDNPQARQEDQALQQAGNGMKQQEGSPLQSFGDSLSKGDYLDAAHKLGTIDPSSLSDAEKQSLASQLDETAGAIGESNPQLAEKMQQAAEALRQGDNQAAQQALQDASQALSQAGQQIHQAQAASQAAGQLAQGQQQILQAGRSPQEGQANAGQGSTSQNGSGNTGQTGGQGQGQNTGQTGSQGQGSSSQSGNNNGSGGAGRGEGNGATGQGPEAGNQPIQGNNGPGDAGERAYEPIYAPEHLGGQGGQDVTLPGSGQPGSQVLGQGNTSPGAEGQSSVPYVEVLPFYTQAYRQAIENGQVPAFMRDLVKKYFSSLEP